MTTKKLRGRPTGPDNELGTADFSKCDKFRYQLTRSVPNPKGHTSGGTDPFLLWIMLNPSVATHIVLDPTVTRCWTRTRVLGYTAMCVVNLFAFRSTDPDELYRQERPVGPKNDLYIVENAKLADLVVCAWGNHGTHLGRGQRVLEMLRIEHRLGDKLRHLGINANGEPKHPLYLPYTKPLEVFP